MYSLVLCLCCPLFANHISLLCFMNMSNGASLEERQRNALDKKAGFEDGARMWKGEQQRLPLEYTRIGEICLYF